MGKKRIRTSIILGLILLTGCQIFYKPDNKIFSQIENPVLWNEVIKYYDSIQTPGCKNPIYLSMEHKGDTLSASFILISDMSFFLHSPVNEISQIRDSIIVGISLGKNDAYIPRKTLMWIFEKYYRDDYLFFRQQRRNGFEDNALPRWIMDVPYCELTIVGDTLVEKTIEY